MAKKLTYPQAQLLAKASDEWESLPGGYGCTNATLEVLERRGLVELRLIGSSSWQWRKVPNA